MTSAPRFPALAGLTTDWRRLLTRGTAMLFFGVALIIAALFKPDAMLMHAREFSWLPAAALLVIAVGIVECFDAAIAKHPTGFFLHLPIGILDLVNGAMIVLSTGLDPAALGLMVAAFLLVKGILRIALAHATDLPHKRSIFYGAALSILAGLMIWQRSPSTAGWLLALGLSVDIAARGWATLMLAQWLRDVSARNEEPMT